MFAILLMLVAVAVGFFVYSTETAISPYAFKLGLDLKGGTHLLYEADTSSVATGDVAASMNALRDVIERRINIFGVSEPVVQVSSGSVFGANTPRLIVELPGVTDISKAVDAIGKTPLLDFRLVAPGITDEKDITGKKFDETFIATGLTGQYLERARLEFDQNSGAAEVSLSFNKDGSDLFEKITKNNVGRILAIFLDGDIKSMPVIREAITGGKAIISGGFVGQEGRVEARQLVQNLNLGALPLPIKLISTESIGATLGEQAVSSGIRAGLWSFAIIALFLILWYRLPGLVASLSLLVYVALNLAIFKLIPVTLTAAGIAAFILSIGMAVDANILIFERLREELARGRSLNDAITEGFARAWLSIRDSNLSSIITAVILYSLASTSLVKGFALVFAVGVLVSMFTAITVSRNLLRAVEFETVGRASKFFFGSGFK
jgi:protein-export membrane protein SecD